MHRLSSDAATITSFTSHERVASYIGVQTILDNVNYCIPAQSCAMPHNLFQTRLPLIDSVAKGCSVLTWYLTIATCWAD